MMLAYYSAGALIYLFEELVNIAIVFFLVVIVCVSMVPYVRPDDIEIINKIENEN